jgi:glucose/arabinose dehydrogenase
MSLSLPLRVLRRAVLPALLVTAGIAIGLGTGLGPWLESWRLRVESKLQRMSADSAIATEPLRGWQWAAGAEASVHSGGWRAPTRLVFHPQADAGDPTRPFYYVAELPGSIQVVRGDGSRALLVERLVDHPWRPGLEAGLMGLAIDRTATRMYYSRTVWNAAAGVFQSEVRRLSLGDQGTKVLADDLLLAIEEATVPSYCVQFVQLDPRQESLFVGVGAGGQMAPVQSLDRFAGKVLRLTLDGAAHPDNPYFDAKAPGSVRSRVYAYGFRNPFDLAWSASGIGFVGDIGPGLDRVVTLVRGRNYCYGFGDGDSAMRSNALYTWGPNGHFAPTGLAVRREEQGERLFIGLFGAVGMPGQSTGKMLASVAIDATGALAGAVEPVAAYRGPFFDSVSAVAIGPDDAIYFADFYGPGDGPPVDRGQVVRVAWVPAAEPPPEVASTSGEQAFARSGCVACHDHLSAVSAKEGPSLAGLRAKLRTRLDSAEYLAALDRFAADEGAFFVAQRPIYAALRGATGDERAKLWFANHVRNPRFDHPESKMPGFAHLPAGEIDLLFEFLYR